MLAGHVAAWAARAACFSHRPLPDSLTFLLVPWVFNLHASYVTGQNWSLLHVCVSDCVCARMQTPGHGKQCRATDVLCTVDTKHVIVVVDIKELYNPFKWLLSQCKIRGHLWMCCWFRLLSCAFTQQCLESWFAHLQRCAVNHRSIQLPPGWCAG